MFLGGVYLLFGVLYGSLGVDGLDCTSKASLQRAQKQCFSQLGLSLGTDFDEIQNVIQKDPQVACRNPEQYRSALKCATDVAKRCLASVGQSVDILPDTDKMTQGLTYMCARIHEVDMPCVQEKQDPMKHCAMAKALAAFSGNSDFDVKDITCKAFEIAVECVHDVLDRCGNKTEAIYAYFTEHYLTPPACGQDGSSSGQGYNVSTAAPMTTVELFTVVPMLPEVSCYSRSSIQAGQQQCFEREGIDVQLPRVSIGGGQQSRQSYLDSVLSNNKDMQSVCRDLPRYQRALSCTMEVGRQCMPQGYKDYLPSASNMHRMLAYVCDNVDDIDQSCVTSKASDLFDCGHNKGMEHRVRDPKALLCSAFEWSVSCAREVLPPCGCKTTRIYAIISKEFLNPPACAAIEQHIPGCSGYTDNFISSPNGGASHSASIEQHIPGCSGYTDHFVSSPNGGASHSASIEQHIPGCSGYTDHFVSSPNGGASHSASIEQHIPGCSGYTDHFVSSPNGGASHSASIEQHIPGCSGYTDHFVSSPNGGASHSASIEQHIPGCSGYTDHFVSSPNGGASHSASIEQHIPGCSGYTDHFVSSPNGGASLCRHRTTHPWVQRLH
ncbi:uncharacterized protein [Littorina saxatilis]|uniref:Uncharacterized protein n=1 Tax=Littorina saxatilis TaxID=31220 RepID=A0AAN9BTZ8_9CAEN